MAMSEEAKRIEEIVTLDTVWFKSGRTLNITNEMQWQCNDGNLDVWTNGEHTHSIPMWMISSLPTNEASKR